MKSAINIMCGILGFTGQPREGQWRETFDILEALYVASEHRGHHATGFVGRAEPFKHPDNFDIVTDKQPVAAKEFIRDNQTWRNLHHRRCTTVLSHVRWATHGPPEVNRNNHPFVGRRGLYLVHNGVLNDHRGVCERRGLTLRTDCDSEAILRLVESSRVPALGLNEAIQEFRGSMAVAVYDGRSDLTYLARNDGRPFWLVRLKQDRRWFFASTRDILLEALTTVLGKSVRDRIELLIPLAAGHVHTLSSEGVFRGLPDFSRTEW